MPVAWDSRDIHGYVLMQSNTTIVLPRPAELFWQQYWHAYASSSSILPAVVFIVAARAYHPVMTSCRLLSTSLATI